MKNKIVAVNTETGTKYITCDKETYGVRGVYRVSTKLSKGKFLVDMKKIKIVK